MSALLAAGWLLAVGAASLLLIERRAGRSTAERVVRACHELRGPLMTVLLALDDPTNPRTSAVAGELARARRAADEVSAAVARRRLPDERRPVDVAELLRGLVAVHDALARRAGRRIELVVEPGTTVVVGDRARLAQALGNLLQNAVEHGEGVVRVRLLAGDDVRIEVHDDGPGLAHPVATLAAGPRRGLRGRGLAIAQDAVRRQGGSLRSAPAARGARLVVELPAGRARGRAAS